MPPALPRELLAVLSSSQTTLNQASDAIEEHIMCRRAKGDTLLSVSSTLHSLESRSPRLAPAIRQAQYVTNVPPAADLTVPPGSLGKQQALVGASMTPGAVLNFLLSTPPPTLLTARKVILEFLLNREARMREKKHGIGGKGTLGRDSFEEIASQLRQIEDGLRGTGQLIGANAPSVPAVPDEELDEPRKTGLALILSLRMLLSYFTLPDLARQLLCQHPTDAERTLVQHIRRRVAGEGRYNVGRELEFVESLTLNRRPALRPAFRSARARTYLPERALYQIALPAPSKSACIKLLGAFVRDVEQAGPLAAQSYMSTPPLSQTFGTTGTSAKDTNSFLSRKVGMGSPASSHSSSQGSPTRPSHVPPPHDPAPVESYALELISEYLTREKREYMLKNRWVKMGREQLGKDLADIESALCVIGKAYPGPHAPSLMPVFLQLRRTFALPNSTLPSKVVEPFLDMLPTPPDADSVPLREPSVSSTTASLYVNPRLPDAEALDLIEELLESEREKGINANVSQEKTIAWLDGLVDQMAKRFPDGSYETAFDQARYLAAHPRVWPDAANSSAFPDHPLVSGGAELGHRRSKSSVHASSPDKAQHPRYSESSMSSAGRHKRSASMPMNAHTHTRTYSDASSHQSTKLSSVGSPSMASETNYNHWAPPEAVRASQSPRLDQGPAISVNEFGGRQSTEHRREASVGSGLGLSGFAASSSRSKGPPPLLNLNVPGPELTIDLGDSPLPREPTSGGALSNGSQGTGGWWDLISPAESPGMQKPWERPKSDLSARSPQSPLGLAYTDAQSPPSPAAALGYGEDVLKGQLSRQPLSPPPPPPPPILSDSLAPPENQSPTEAPMTPQMEARIAQLLNPGSFDADATPRTARTTADTSPEVPQEMPRPQMPEMNAATMESLARLEGVQLHDESLAKLEGTQRSLPAVNSIAVPQPHVPSKSSTSTPKATTPPKEKERKVTPPSKEAPPARTATPEDDLYARLDFVPMDYNPMHTKPATRPTGPIFPTKAGAGVARSNTQRSPPNGAQPVWPRRKGSDARPPQAAKDGLPPLKTVNESGGGATSAPPRTSESAHEGEGLNRSMTLGKRPPPVPTTINRPGFPTPGAGPSKSHDDQRHSAGESTKSKFGAFINRSMTRRDKENSSSQSGAGASGGANQSQRRANPSGVANKPGQWNRDMVAGIMGPSVSAAERRHI